MTTALRKIQVGQESTPGTKVAATAKLIGALTMKEEPVLSRPKEERGRLARYHRTTVVGEQVALTFEGEATFEQIIYLLNMAVKKVTTGTGAGADKTWSFTPNLAAVNTPNTFTIEYGNEVQEHEVEYCIASGLEIRGTIDEALVARADIFGRNLEASSFTAALSDPSSLESILMNKTKLYIDAAGGTIGTTEKAATIIDFAWRLETGFIPKKHGGANLFFDSYGQDAPHLVVEMTVEFSAGIETERTMWAAGTRRLFRLEATGSAIDGQAHKLTLDFAGVYTDFSSLEEREGSDVVSVTIEAEYDPDWAKLFDISVVNTISSLT